MVMIFNGYVLATPAANQDTFKVLSQTMGVAINQWHADGKPQSGGAA